MTNEQLASAILNAIEPLVLKTTKLHAIRLLLDANRPETRMETSPAPENRPVVKLPRFWKGVVT
jgi:hypothetical protein